MAHENRTRNAGFELPRSSPDTSGTVEPDAYDFQFVEVPGPSHCDEETRTTVRTHVMRDFYGRRRSGRQPSCRAEIISAASLKEGVSQQTHRFRNGPYGLQEVLRKRRRQGSVPRKSWNAPALATTCIDKDENIQEMPTSQQPLSAERVNFDKELYSTTSGNLEGQPVNPPKGVTQGQLDTSTLDSRNQVLRSDPLASFLGTQDPFNSIPLPNTTRTQILLYHANNSILASPLMGQLRTEWLSLATQDPALCHIALSHYAGNYGLTRRAGDPTESLRFRMESIRIVNERLENQESALADGTMGTVASLSSYEATNGSLSAVRTHLQGLQKMVRLRGGIQKSGMNSYIARLVLWADLNCGNALACNPIFPPLECHNVRIRTQRSDDLLREESISSLADMHLVNKDLVDRFTDLRNLCSLNSFPGRRQTVGKDEQIRKSDEVYFIERSLLTLSNLFGPRSFVTSCCIAAIIFIDNQLRGIAFNARLIARLVARLQLSMELFLSSAKLAADTTTPRAIIWTFYVGGIAAGNGSERDWFIKRLIDFCDIVELSCWEDAQSILRGFLWPAAWDFQGNLLWDCVEQQYADRNGLLNSTFNMEDID